MRDFRNMYINEFERQDLTNITLEEINDLFVAFGSAAWGVSREKSDVDFLIPPEKLRFAWAILKQNNSKRDDYYYEENVYSYKFVIEDGIAINFIISRGGKQQYDSWVDASGVVKELSRNYYFREIIKDKNTRIDMFQKIVGIINVDKGKEILI